MAVSFTAMFFTAMSLSACRLAPRPGRRRIGLCAAPVLLAGALGGCVGFKGEALRAENPYLEPAPISVRFSTAILELPDDRALSDAERRALASFARRYRAAGDDVLTVAYPSEGAARARKAARAVAAEARRHGVPKARIKTGAYSTEQEGERGVVLSYKTAVATAAPCPTPSGDITRDAVYAAPRDFGCAIHGNLAAMIDRPTDLLTPRPLTPADAQRRATVLQLYRGGETTASADADRRASTVE